MLCKKPFHKNGASFGCGQCMPCRINKRRLWTHRIVLEALVSASASFITLTYEDMPENGSLVPRDLSLWLKRFRKAAGPHRFFAVGEYGDQSWRPHYHVCLFGRRAEDGDLVQRTWALGFTSVGTLTFQSAAYCAGYVTKKMTVVDDVRLGGRCPEFARMSLRPGIGAVAIPQIADSLRHPAGEREIARLCDVPDVLRHGPTLYPLGRYLRAKLRAGLNVEGRGNGLDIFKESARVQALYAAHKASKSTKTFAAVMEEKRQQKILNMETKAKVFSKKGGV